MLLYELLGRTHLDDAPVLDDRHAVAESFGFFHQVSCEKYRGATVSDAGHEGPDRAPRLRIESRRELVEEHDLRLVDEGQRDEEPLLLSARERHEPRVALGFQPKPCEERVGISDVGAVERSPE